MREPLEEIRPRRTETLRGCADPLTAFKVTIVPLDDGDWWDPALCGQGDQGMRSGGV